MLKGKIVRKDTGKVTRVNGDNAGELWEGRSIPEASRAAAL